MNDMFIRIVTEVQESEEEFIFTTIQPFCEEVTKRKISKAELVKLLSQPQIVRCGECIHAPKCYGDIVMVSKGGGEKHCPVEYCSMGEWRTGENG